jgi:hypothetical protein
MKLTPGVVKEGRGCFDSFLTISNSHFGHCRQEAELFLVHRLLYRM